MRATKILVVAAIASCRPTSSYDPSRPTPDRRAGFAAFGMQAAMRAEYKSQASRVEAPLALASDGSELSLKAVKANVSIEGPVARTELHFTFHNPDHRQREGRFRIDLPEGAAVGRFAMKIGGVWRESRVVSRDQGRQVYEGFLHQKVDPALLEQDLGNRFSARVFPIAAREDKELIIGYDQLVSPEQPYTLALRGLPAIPSLSIAVEHDGERTLTERSGAVPEDLVVPVAAGDAAVAGDGGVFVARLAPDAASTVAAPLDRVLFLVDTSASRQPVMGTQVELVTKLVAALPPATPIAIAAYDHEVRELYRGPAEAAGKVTEALFDHGALGASNLGAALTRAASAGMTRVVIIGDGVATLGETDGGKLAALAGGALERIDAIQIGSAIDRSVLGAIVRAGKQPGAILDGRDPALVVRGLSTALPPERPITVAGAAESWPRSTRGLAPGAPLFVTGRLKLGSPELAIEIGGKRVRLTARAGDASRIGRAVARAEVADLTERATVAKDGGDKAALDARIEKVALAHNLVSSRTSLLVLESDADELRTLGPREGVKSPTTAARPEREQGEVIRIRDSAPTIDPTSTTQGITIDRDYLKTIPVPGRTFEAALGSVAGSQRDGVTFSGATSIENTYYVDGINTTGVRMDTMSALGHDQLSRYLRSNAFAFGMPQPRTPAAAPTKAPVAARVVVPAKPQEPDSPYKGELHQVMSSLAAGRRDEALARSNAWRNANPGDVASLIALGESLEARGAVALAARAYASIIDLYPNRFELVRAAAERLDRVSGARGLAIDAYRRSLKERPDQLSTYRLLAFALVRDGNATEALDQLLAARRKASNSVREVLLQDARVIAAHLVATGTRQSTVEGKLGLPIATVPSLHLVLGWETDANDVDLHVVDKHGNHAFYSTPKLASGGRLIDDLTDGYGPEMFSVDWPQAYPYSIAVHYFSAGPMGLGMGTVQVIKHDGKGKLEIEDRPFVLQKDGVTIPLGQVR
jgi:hypothetical protein